MGDAVFLAECDQFAKIAFLVPEKRQTMPGAGDGDQFLGRDAGIEVGLAHPMGHQLVVIAMIEDHRQWASGNGFDGRAFLQRKATIEPCAQPHKGIQELGGRCSFFITWQMISLAEVKPQ